MQQLDLLTDIGYVSRSFVTRKIDEYKVTKHFVIPRYSQKDDFKKNNNHFYIGKKFTEDVFMFLTVHAGPDVIHVTRLYTTW